MDIHRDRSTRKISLTQSRLITDLLEKYGMAECKPESTPLSAATKLTKDGEPLDTTIWTPPLDTALPSFHTNKPLNRLNYRLGKRFCPVRDPG